MKLSVDKRPRLDDEVRHFSNNHHIWWGVKTFAGQERYKYRFQLIKKLCRPRKMTKVLEIGCGDGEFTKHLATLPGIVVATDATRAVIDQIRKKYQPKNLRLRVENCEQLSFRDSTFDIVCGTSILHHVSTVKALMEAYRVLKPKGKIFFSEPNLLNPIAYAAYNSNWLRQKMEFTSHEMAFTRFYVSRLLEDIGFKNIEVNNSDFLYPSTPSFLVPFISRLSRVIEATPIIKEISGSLIISAQKN